MPISDEQLRLWAEYGFGVTTAPSKNDVTRESDWVRMLARELLELHSLGKFAFGKDATTGDWYCWCRSCVGLRQLLTAPPSKGGERG